MSMYGEPPEAGGAEEGDRWNRLYAPGASDTGHSRQNDTPDDRFASVTRTVAASVTEPSPADRGTVPAQRQGAGGPAPGPPPASGPPPAPGSGRGAAPALLPQADPTALADLVPDSELDAADHGGVVLRATSVRGAAGRRSGRPRGDALLTASFGSGEDGLLLLAVATGGGESAHGHRAARAACRSIGGRCRASSHPARAGRGAGRRTALMPGLNRLTGRTCRELRAQAAALGTAPAVRTLGLRCLLVPADPRCRFRICFGSGGGGFFLLRDGAWQDADPAPSGPEATGAETARAETSRAEPGRPSDTDSLTDPDAESDTEPAAQPFRFRFRVHESRPEDVLLLCSTGFSGPLRESDAFSRGLADEWGGPGRPPPDLAAFFAGVGPAAENRTDEDRTAAGVWEAR